MTEEASVSIRPDKSPELGVPPGYSKVVEVRGGHIIFIAGQTALDRNGELVGKAKFAQQAAQVFQNSEYRPSVRRLCPASLCVLPTSAAQYLLESLKLRRTGPLAPNENSLGPPLVGWQRMN
jgi:hypothetical protein